MVLRVKSYGPFRCVLNSMTPGIYTQKNYFSSAEKVNRQYTLYNNEIFLFVDYFRYVQIHTIIF